MPNEQPCSVQSRVDGSEGAWTYLFSGSTDLGSSLSVGTQAEPRHYYIRSFQQELVCRCGGKKAIVITNDNYEIGAISDHDQSFTVAKVDLTFPALGGLAAQVAIGVAERVLGPSLDLGWLEGDAVKARAESVLGQPEPDIVEVRPEEPAPVAVCGDHIRLASGYEMEWPGEDQVVSLPTMTPEEARAWKLKREMERTGLDVLKWLARWLEQIRDMLRSDDEEVREEGERQLERLKQMLDRILNVLRRFEHDAEELRDEGAEANGDK